MSGWDSFTSGKSLKEAWHLTRSESKADLLDNNIEIQNIGWNLDSEIAEISRALTTNDYRAGARKPVEIPKSNFGTRPGSVLTIKDRIVLWSAIKVLAPIIDPLLPDGVYSYRLKKEPTKTSLFRENDISSYPFLKQAHISREIDDLEPWYKRWEEFDQSSKKDLDIGYEYLSITDISAYFENINITILRDILLEACKDDQNIVNIVIHCFASWAPITPKGLRPQRGIPQGSGVSSFFGNIYLLELDRFFLKLSETMDLKYYRYMDDVRIFTKKESDARQVVLDMETQLRRLHLNVQSAKTKILSASKKEIEDHLYDYRFERAKILAEKLKEEEDPTQIDRILNDVERLLREKPTSRRSISRARKNMTSLESRTLRYAGGILNAYGRGMHIDMLFNGVKDSPDPRMMRSFVSSMRCHPKKTKFNRMIHEFVKSDFNLFGYQEGELLRGLRHVGKLDHEWKDYCLAKIEDTMQCDHVRYQAVQLLNRYMLGRAEAKRLLEVARKEQNPYIINALLVMGGQFNDYNQYSYLINHFKNSRNSNVSSTLATIVALKENEQFGKKMADYAFSDETGNIMISNMGYLWHLTRTKNEKVLLHLQKPLKFFVKKHPVFGFRWVLERFAERIERHLV